jgi:adenylate cyclase
MSQRHTAAVLFTDLVGSTELLHRLGEDRADEVRRHHFSLLRTPIHAHSGREVKNLGDGLMVVFSSAQDALRCGIEMQQRVGEATIGELDSPLRDWSAEFLWFAWAEIT